MTNIQTKRGYEKGKERVRQNKKESLQKKAVSRNIPSRRQPCVSISTTKNCIDVK